MRMRRQAAVILCLVPLSAACSGGADTAGSPRTAPTSSAQEAITAAAPLRGLDERWPSTIKGPLGTSHTSAYDKIARPSTTDMPYKGRGFANEHSYLGVASVAELAERSRLIVRGTISAISRPHFNADDGAFWDPALVDEPGIVDSESFIMRDVTLHVTAVIASAMPDVTPGQDLIFGNRGGQVQVDMNATVSKVLGFPEAGTYVLSNRAEVALTVGDDVVVFLNSTPIHGLYGGSYGYEFRYFPAQEQNFAFRVSGASFTDLAPAHPLALDSATLANLGGAGFGSKAGPEPKPGTFRKDPHTEP